MNANLIIFGGTFDPPHQGHWDCLQQVHSQSPNSEIHVVPSYHPPVSSSLVKAPAASFDHRFEMCRIAFANIPKTQITDVEKFLPTPSYTLQTLRHFKIQNPSLNISLLLGADQVENFHQWHEPLSILEIASLLLLPRKGFDLEPVVQNLLKTLQIRWVKRSEGRVDLESYRPIFMMDTSVTPAASRDIRNNLEKGLPVSKGWLNTRVVQYIHEHELYSFKK